MAWGVFIPLRPVHDWPVFRLAIGAATMLALACVCVEHQLVEHPLLLSLSSALRRSAVADGSIFLSYILRSRSPLHARPLAGM